MEENKINSRQITPKKFKKNDKETVEISLGRPNPAFNLISIKARYRYHQIKNSFSKYDYKAYMRRCKNMYSISSKMSSELNMSEIYHGEKQNIDGILDIYHRIDDKISSKRIRLTKVKKNNPKFKLLKEKSLSAVNILRETPNIDKFKISSNDFDKDGNDIKFQTQKLKENKNRNINNDKKLSSTFSSNFKGDFSNIFINSKMANSNAKLKKKESNNYKIKKNLFFDENKNRFNKTFSPSFKAKKLISNKIQENIENDINIRDNNPKKKSEDYGLYNFKTKQTPLSGKSTGMTITNFGAIIYNNSIYRNKNISNFLYNNQILPLIYSSKY